MGIILSILKILGIILLALIGLLVFAVLLILFVPIRYGIKGNVHEVIHIEGKVSWLLHLLRAKFSYEDELLYAEIGILWKKIHFSKEFTDSEDEEEPDETDEAEVTETTDTTDTTAPECDKKTNSKANAAESSEKETDKAETLNHKIDNILKFIKDKIIFIQKKLKQIKTLIQDEKNQQAIMHIKDELFYLIKIILPKKSSLKGVFSTGSPDTTGQAYGVICCFPIIYQDNWSLVPDFEAEKAYFEGDFTGKGRIYIYKIVGILLRIMIDKNCRRLYYILKRLGGRTNGRRK